MHQNEYLWSKALRFVQVKNVCNSISNLAYNNGFVFERYENFVGEKAKILVPEFSPFSTFFSPFFIAESLNKGIV